MIEIKVTGNTPLEALSSLTAFGIHCMTNPEVATAANRILDAEKKAEGKKTAQTIAPTTPTAPMSEAEAKAMGGGGQNLTPGAGGNGATNPKPKPEEPPAGSTAAPSDPEPKKAPTLEEVRAAGIEAARQYGNDAVKVVLRQFGAENMTGLAKKDYVAFLEGLKGLGDNYA